MAGPWICVCFAFLSFVLVLAEPIAGADLNPQSPYTANTADPITHQVDFSVVVTPPYHCRVLKVWLPIPQSDGAQKVEKSRFSTYPLSVKPTIHTEPVYGNGFAYFEFHEPHGAQIIRHQFTAKVWSQHWDLDASQVQSVGKWPASFEPFLRPQPLQDEASLRKVLDEIVPRQQDAKQDLTRVMDWINNNLTYDHTNCSLEANAEHGFTQRRGHCSDYHGLCSTMGRALGYPTRVTYGLALFPKNSPSHCKLEAFLPPHGWVSFDLSETQKLIAKIKKNDELSQPRRDALAAAARRRLLAGFRENSWLLLTKGTDYELAPKAARRVRVVRTAYIEADGEALPDPDPANIKKREFGWMTVHHYQADRPFKKFKDISTLD